MARRRAGDPALVDALGNVLQVGDSVIHTCWDSGRLYQSTVLRFGRKKVILHFRNETYVRRDGVREPLTYCVYPDRVAKIG